MLVNLKKAPYNPVQQADTGQKHRIVASAKRAAYAARRKSETPRHAFQHLAARPACANPREPRAASNHARRAPSRRHFAVTHLLSVASRHEQSDDLSRRVRSARGA